ncbi:5033_t:CDS:1, partial [Gigaspora rosea]
SLQQKTNSKKYYDLWLYGIAALRHYSITALPATTMALPATTTTV